MEAVTGADLSFVNLGITIEHLPNSITVFGFRIAFYGIIIGLGMLAGMAIAEVPLKKVFCTPRNYLPVFLRLLGVPLVIVLLLWAVHASLWIPDGKSILMTVYLSAITPACATVTSMAQLYDRDASHSSAIYILSTLLSILTMPLMIGLFELLL